MDPPLETAPQQPYSEHKELIKEFHPQQTQQSFPMPTHTDLAPIGVIEPQQPQGGGGGAEW